jgi:hypothetical protein
MFFFLLCFVATLAILIVACPLLFAIGKFNQLVTSRQRISTEMLQLDLTLRMQSAVLQALGSSLSTELVSKLALAEEKSHRAVSGHLSGDNLAMLFQASDLIVYCWESANIIELAAAGRDIENYLERTWAIRKRINRLIDDYRNILGVGPFCALARICGFAPIFLENSLPNPTYKVSW